MNFQISNYLYIITLAEQFYRHLEFRFFLLLGTVIAWLQIYTPYSWTTNFPLHIIRNKILEAALKNPMIACSHIAKLYPRATKSLLVLKDRIDLAHALPMPPENDHPDIHVRLFSNSSDLPCKPKFF